MPTPSARPGLALLAATPAEQAVAAELAQRLGLPLLETGGDPVYCEDAHTVLMIRDSSLCLQRTGRPAPGPITVDFGSAYMRHRRRSGQNDLLGRAVGVGKKSRLHVLDATAGLGRDGFVLADLGCVVDLCEREPVIAELLSWGMREAASGEDRWLADVMSRMRLYRSDARELPADSLRGVDVIYLDPMFPSRGKSAAVKKEMALLQLLLDGAADPQDARELLVWALQQDVARIVVKRPAKAPGLGDRQPSHCVSGKAVRYDVFVRRKLE